MRADLPFLKRCHGVVSFGALMIVTAALLLPVAPRKARAADERGSAQGDGREVTIDVVARDKKGNPVTDLKQGDIEITEDGVKQKITALRLVIPGTQSAAGAADPLQNVRLVTMVFQNQLSSPDGQNVARRAVSEFLKMYSGSDILVGMFTLDKRFCIVQQYTNNKEHLREALDKAINQDTEPLQRDSDAIQKQLASIAAGAAPAAPDRALGGTGDPLRDARLAQITGKMLQNAEALATDQGGWRTVLLSLQAVANELQVVPGRKTVLYFAWGLWVPREQLDQVARLQSVANRAHVSIYPVYLAGLTSYSQARSAAEALKDATAASKSESAGGAVGTWGATASQAGESAITANALEALSNLGKATSGILMGDSNDFASPMQAIYSDINNYYVVSYVPQNTQYDGKYRRINVKIPKAKTVLARNGYFATPPSGEAASALLPYEASLMAVLDQPSSTHTFDYRLRAPHFESRNGVTRHMLIMEVPLEHFQFAEDPKTKKLQCQFAMMAVVKDAAGKVVEKVSQSYPLEVPPDRVDAYKKSSLFLSREVRLPQGKYSLEGVAYDKAADKSSVLKVPIEVPAVGGGIQVSSLSIIKKVDTVGPGDTDASNPFRIGNRKISPFAEDPVTLKVGSPLRMYLVVYPDTGSAEKPMMELEILQGGSSLGKIPAELPAPDAEGKVQYSGTLPTDSFAPGQYELRVIVTQGGNQADARTGLILVQ